jgi:TonB-linked SusC/RagA family outer membrane protein
MRRKLWVSFCAMLFFITAAVAQNVTVTGKVTDDKGAAIEGASVLEKGTTNGTTTNSLGVFTLQVKQGATITVSAVGFGKMEMAAKESMTISLKPGSDELNEVVVTALGIKREKKALGYAVSTIGQKDLEMKPETDVSRVLNGKAPGVNIINTSGLSGSGTNIIIRGISSITGNSQPLFIVDGVPFNSSTNTQANFNFGNNASSRFLDIDPNNIASINVLKGLSATTLYGEAGRNGVILITTKNGAAGRVKKKSEITVTQSVFQNTVANLPEYTTQWGGGFENSPGVVFFSNWGGPISNPPDSVAHPYDKARYASVYPEYVGQKYAYKYYPSVENFFRKGFVSTTSVNAGGTSGNFSYNANYSYTDDKGFTPGNNLTRNTFGFGGIGKLSNKFTVQGTMNYVSSDVVSPPTGTSFGSGSGNISVFGDVLYTPTTIDLINLPFQSPVDGSSTYYRNDNGIQHPFWTVENAFVRTRVNRAYGNMQLTYDFNDHLKAFYRIGFDNYTEFGEYAQNKGGVDNFATGIYRTTNGRNTIWDHTFLVNYNGNLADNWSLNVDAGLNPREIIYEQNGTKSLQQLVYGTIDHSNFIVHDVTSESGADLDVYFPEFSLGAFAQATVGYNDFLYFNIGGRNSWSSTLEQENRTLFYPNVSASFIPTSAIESLKGNKTINYLKLRAGYSTSARFADVFSTRQQFFINTNSFVDAAGTVVNSNTISNQLANPDLQPELQQELEVGVEGKFIDSRLGIDLTLYRRLAKDQILGRDIDPATGYSFQLFNAGDVENKGIELMLNYDLIRNRNWNWKLTGIWTLNRSLVSNIPDELKQIAYAGFTNLGNFAINGEQLGIMQGYPALRDEKTGERVVGADGNYIVSTELQPIGDPNPLYKLVGISELSYKQFSFRMQWDYQVGGDFYSTTAATLLGRGVTKDTEFDRYLPLILPGVKEDGTPNDIQTSATSVYFNQNVGTAAPNDLQVYNGTFIKLREASLSYNLPKSLLDKTPFGAVSISVEGSNLWYLAPYFPRYINFDPEANSLGVGNGRGFDYLVGPSSRRVGASLRITF